MVKRFSRFFRGGFIAVICAALQSQVFAFPVLLNNKGLDNGTVSMSKPSGVEGTDIAAFLESSGDSATISAQANTGYEFEKWTVSIYLPTGSEALTVTDNPYKITYNDFASKYGTDDFTVQCTPSFKGIEIRVNLNSNSSSATESPSVITVIYSSTYGNLPIPTRPGYNFEGWYTDPSGGVKITSSTMVEVISPQTLYAHWSAKTYEVVLNPNKGSVGTTTKNVIYDSTYGDLPIATRVGYTFNGWYTSASGGTKIISTTKVQITEGQTLYAQWTANSYNVMFNVNGGGVDIPSKSVIYDSTYGDLSTPTRTGYEFSGWYTATSGGTKITSETKVQITSTQTLYARWVAKTYLVIFDSNGGSVDPLSKSVVYDSSYGDLPVPIRAGYTFNGWYTTAFGGAKVISSTRVQITAEQILYAQWTANEYIVEFDSNGGSVSSLSKRVIYDATYGVLPTPTRKGYTFIGWYTDTLGGVKISASTKVQITTTQILYAQWLSNEYTVSFDANGGSCDKSSQSVTYDSTYGDLPIATRVGYAFKGWYTSPSGGTKITSSTKVQITAEQTLYAQWLVGTSIVIFNANGGSVNISSKSVAYDSTYGDLPTPTRTGYAFKGWYTSPSGGSKIESTMKVQITEDQTLYAQWTAKTYTVYLNANSGHLDVSSITVTYNSKYSGLPIPTRTGYTFKGWYTATSGGTQITAETRVQITATQTLYAQWTAMTYIVTFNANGGEVGTMSKTVMSDSSYGVLPIPTRTGYAFKGWYTAISGGAQITAETKVQITAAQTLYAQWSAISYTIEFDGNGATSGWQGSIYNVEYDESKTLPENAFLRQYRVVYDGNGGSTPASAISVYQFEKWNTVKDGSGGTYENGATVKNLLSENGTIVLYAQWVAASVTLPEMTLDDYSFKGWYTAESGGERIGGPGDSFTPTNNITLYAQWGKMSYAVSFDPTGGEFVGEGAPIYVRNEEKYPALPEVTRVGYGFAGWRLLGEIEIREGDTVSITSNSCAYAVWTNNVYTVIFRKGEAFYGEDFSTNVFYDVPFTLPENSFENIDGSTFAGWSLPNGSLLPENAVVNNLATSGSIEIVATWARPTDSLNVSGVCKNMFITGTSSGDQEWKCILLDGEKCLASGDAKGGRSVLQARVVGASGHITFKWRYEGNSTLKKYFYPGGEELANKYKELIDSDDPEGVWMEVAWEITAEMIASSGGEILWGVNKATGQYASEPHTLYIKDVVWIPDGYTENDESVTFTYEDNDGTERTASVPKSWVDENNLLPTGSEDYKAALEASSGKIGSNGAALPYWYDYVAGTNPNDPNDIFRITSISVTNSTVFLTWHPDLSSNALAREYKVLGKASLSDPDESWAPTNSASRFFRVDVHLKK